MSRREGKIQFFHIKKCIMLCLDYVFIGLQCRFEDKYDVTKLTLDINLEFFEFVILVFILLSL